MNWKLFRNLYNKQNCDETHFILGIDLGNDSSAIAFFNTAQGAAEIVDISGGYGRQSIPTVVQYVSETREWVFGEYALLNNGSAKDVTITNLFEKIGRREYIDIDNKPVGVVNIVGLFLKEMISNIKSINPKAEIVGIVASIPSYFSEEAKQELTQAFKYAGYEKELIALVPDRECLFINHFYENYTEPERVLLLDYGSRELRGGVYDVWQDDGVLNAKCVSSLFDAELGAKIINDRVRALFTEFYCDETGVAREKIPRQTRDQLAAFVYQHKDLLFQKNILQKPVKLYFNFVYPPFQRAVGRAVVDEIIGPFYDKLEGFINSVLEKNLSEGLINAGEIKTILCVGGGFEMLWVRDTIRGYFPKSKIVSYKNPKCAAALGAALTAAAMLTVVETKRPVIEDRHQINVDIGINIKSGGRDKFLPVIERNSFWWQRHKARSVIINDDVADAPLEIDVLVRNALGETNVADSVSIDGLPHRPKGTTRLSFSFQFLSNNEIEVNITDIGFGEMFPASGYERKQAVYIG